MNFFKTLFNEHKEYKYQLKELTKMELLKAYKSAAFGWLWLIIKPGIKIFVYWFAFAFGLRYTPDVNQIPFFLWLLAGIVPWFYMSEMIVSGADCFLKNRHLVTKMKFPISIIPTYINISKIILNSFLVLVVIVIFGASGFYPNIYYLQVFFYIFLMFLFFNMWSYFAAPISVISKDFLNFIKAFTLPLFWLSGIIWNLSGVENKILDYFNLFNPIAYLVNGFRNAFINEVWFWEQPLELVCFLVVLGLVTLGASHVYQSLRKEIPDVL